METNNESARARKSDILSGKQSLASLDYASTQDRDIALSCIKEQSSLAHQLDVNNDKHRAILKTWISESYSNLLLLDAKQLHPELVGIYLFERLRDKTAFVAGADVYESYDRKHVVSYRYETKVGEQVGYFDKMLGIPTSLNVEAKFKFKIEDAVELLESIDVELNRVSLGLVVERLIGQISDAMRDVLPKLIDEKNLNYFDISRYFGVIADELKKTLGKNLSSRGLSVSDVRILNITIPNDTDVKLQRQYFALAEMERIKQCENRLQEESLKLYEAKASIHKKYPDYPVTLTEAEKDLAVDRYLKRIQKYEERKADFTDTHDSRDPIPPEEVLVKPEPPVEPQPPVGTKKWRILFSVAAALYIVAGALVAALANLIAGLCIIGVGIVGFTVLGILKRDMIKDGISKDAKFVYDSKRRTYDDEHARYVAAMTVYNKKMEELKTKEAARKAEEQKKADEKKKSDEQTDNLDA